MLLIFLIPTLGKRWVKPSNVAVALLVKYTLHCMCSLYSLLFPWIKTNILSLLRVFEFYNVFTKVCMLINMNLSYRWQTARRLILLRQRAAVMHVVFPALRTCAISFDALNEVEPLEIAGSYLIWENQNGWATIRWRWHVYRLRRFGTTHKRDRHTQHSHVAITIAAVTHCVGRQNT